MLYIGVCSNIRQNPPGEKAWHAMMNAKIEISLAAFQFLVSNSQFLYAFGLSFNEANAQDCSAKAYFSHWGNAKCVFYQNASFEYVWLLP